MGAAISVSFAEVEVVNQTRLSLLCRIGEQRHWIDPSRLLSGTTIRRIGDVGVLVLARAFARERGLVPRRRPRSAARPTAATRQPDPVREARAGIVPERVEARPDGEPLGALLHRTRE